MMLLRLVTNVVDRMQTLCFEVKVKVNVVQLMLAASLAARKLEDRFEDFAGVTVQVGYDASDSGHVPSCMLLAVDKVKFESQRGMVFWQRRTMT